MASQEFDPASAALVLIDLQKGIVSPPRAPRSGAEVVSASAALAQAFRQAGRPVVLVRVAWSADGGDMLRSPTDAVLRRPGESLPADFADLVPEIGPKPGDILITKRQWGAFTGTELDLQLRRRGVKTIVLAGIATNFGVESTARHAWELGYDLIVAEDATTSISAEAHCFSIKTVLPLLGRVRACEEIIAALS